MMMDELHPQEKELRQILKKLGKDRTFTLTLWWESSPGREDDDHYWSATITDIDCITGDGYAEDQLSAVSGAIVGYFSNYEKQAESKEDSTRTNHPE